MSSRYALGYILLGIAALALFAIPLWYGYRDNLGTFRAYVPGAEMQRLVDIFHRDGAQAAAAAVEAYLPSLPRDEVIVFADPDRRRLAGSLPAWPAEVPDVAGTYGLVIGLGAEQSMRVVVSHQTLPGGYRLLMGRESVRFQSLVERFWYGIAGAVAIVLGLGALFAWRLRRSLLLQIGEIARNAAVIVEGDPSRRLPARGSLPELDTLAQTMNRLLEQQTKYLDELFDLAPDAIVLTELNPSRIVRVNREFTRVFGYTSEEAVGRSLRELIAPGEVGVDYAASAAAIAAGQRVDMELVRQRKDGTRLHVHFTSAAIKTGEATSAAYLVYRDITERKLAEQALRASEARFRGLTELSSDWYWEQDENLRFTYLSNQALDLTGYTGESSLGKHRWEIVNMTPLSCSWREHQAVLAAQQPFRDLECRRVGPDGTVRYLSISGAPIFDEQGLFKGYRGIGRNITQRKGIEEALRRSEQGYALAMEAAEDAHWDWDMISGEYYLSPRTNQVYGFPAGTKLTSREEVLAALPYLPEEREAWVRATAELFAGMGERLSMEQRAIVRGEIRWIQRTGVCVRDSAGKPIRWSGSARDVTDRRRAEEALRLSEGRYALAMEAAGDGHTDWNLLTGEHYISPRLLQICGHAPDSSFRDRADWVRRFPFHPEDRPKWQRAVAAHLAGREPPVTLALRSVVRGAVRWRAGQVLSTRDAAGTPIRWTGSIADITEQKRAEEALRTSEERYALAVAGSDDGVWDVDFSAGRVFLSARARELTGLPPGPEMVPFDQFQAMLPIHPDDAPRRIAALQAHLTGEAPAYEGEFRLRQLDGVYRWRRIHGICVRDANGQPQRLAGSFSDVDARRRAEDALRASEERYSLAVEAAEEGYVDANVDTDEFFTSERLNEIFGIAPGTRFANRSDFLKHFRFYGNDADLYHSTIRAVGTKGGPDRYEFEFRIVRASGEVRWLWTRGKVTRDAEGRARRRIGVVADITPRKLAQEALRLSEERYALALEVAEEGHLDWNVQIDEFFASAQAKRVMNVPQDAEYRTHDDVMSRVPYHPDDAPRVSAAWRASLAGRGTEHELDYRILRGDEPRWIRGRWKIFRDATGVALRVIGIVTDITDRKHAVETLRESEGRFRRMTELSADTYWEQDENFRYTRTGEGADIAGYATDVNQGKTRWGLSGEPTPLSSSWLEHQATLEAHQAFRDFEYRRLRPDGTMGYYSASGAPMFDAEGRFRGYQGVARDITERKRVEEALRQSEERFALAVEGANEGIFDWDLVSDRVYVSFRAQELFGLPRGELWRPRRDWRHILSFHPDDAARLHNSIKAHIEGGAPTYDEEFRILVPGGGVRWFRQRGIALRDGSGKAYRVVGSIGDVTEKHAAEEELGRLERQLRLAQRLEAMGTLAGGIAHDFNNILGAILGYGEMALRDAPKGSRLARDLDSIVVAGERGRALVDRVLAFSRSGVGERVPVHVEKVVREALDLISAKLPPNVTLHAKLHAGTAAMLGDATQVHQVLMNLATNGVQAMPAGGTLRVSLNAARLETPRTPTLGVISAGDYLILEVADNGTGIAPEILERIFDPFFTTKDVGTGTGLGLSLVHGIVAELGGAIDVASTPGAGSTFTVFLPRSGDALASLQKEEPELPRGEGQRVLVVDDEEPLVRLATRTLEELGYQPTGFTSSTAALAAFRADPQRFDALITDERMPGMSGSSLIREVRVIRGGIPIVLMSGYVGGAVSVRARDLAASLARVLHS